MGKIIYKLSISSLSQSQARSDTSAQRNKHDLLHLVACIEGVRSMLYAYAHDYVTRQVAASRSDYMKAHPISLGGRSLMNIVIHK